MKLQSWLSGRLRPALWIASALMMGAVVACGGSNEDVSSTAGMPKPCSVRGKVFRDVDLSGRRDADKPPVAGARVTLKKDSKGSGVFDTEVAVTTTTADGSFAFEGLAAGSYAVGASATGLSPTTFAGDVSPPLNLTEGTDETLDVGMN